MHETWKQKVEKWKAKPYWQFLFGQFPPQTEEYKDLASLAREHLSMSLVPLNEDN